MRPTPTTGTLELNPGSPFYVGSTGYLLTLAGDCERGRLLLEKAVAMNPCHPRWFNHGLCVYHYQKGDYERAHRETPKAAFGIAFWGPLLRAAVLGQLGRTVRPRRPSFLRSFPTSSAAPARSPTARSCRTPSSPLSSTGCPASRGQLDSGFHHPLQRSRSRGDPGERR